MNFQVGDKVRIRSENDLINEYGVDFYFPPGFSFGFAPSMRAYLGEKGTVMYTENDGVVHIDIDHGIWRWHPDWLYKE